MENPTFKAYCEWDKNKKKNVVIVSQSGIPYGEFLSQKP